MPLESRKKEIKKTEKKTEGINKTIAIVALGLSIILLIYSFKNW